MCTPALLAAVPAITLLVSAAATGVSIAQAVEQGKAAEDQADFIEDKARYEAIILDRAQKTELVKNGIAARREYGRVRTQFAGTGNDLGFGSTAAFLQETVRFQAIDQALISQNAQNAAVGLGLQGRIARFNGRVGGQGAAFRAGGLALSGLAQAGGSFVQNIRAQQRFEAITSSPSARLASTYQPRLDVPTQFAPAGG